MNNKILVSLLLILTICCKAQVTPVASPSSTSSKSIYENDEEVNAVVRKIVLEAEIEKQSKIIEANETENDRNALMQRGLSYLGIPDYAKALEDFKKLSSLHPDDAGAHFYLGVTKLSLGQFDCEDFKKAKLLGFKTDWSKIAKFCGEL